MGAALQRKANDQKLEFNISAQPGSFSASRRLNLKYINPRCLSFKKIACIVCSLALWVSSAFCLCSVVLPPAVKVGLVKMMILSHNNTDSPFQMKLYVYATFSVVKLQNESALKWNTEILLNNPETVLCHPAVQLGMHDLGLGFFYTVPFYISVLEALYTHRWHTHIHKPEPRIWRKDTLSRGTLRGSNR